MTKPKERSPQYVFKTAAKYLDPKQIAWIKLAYRFAALAHQGQFRQSGRKYITHPTQVAAILAELQMDYQTVCAGFLHDVIEDTSVTNQQLERKFGREIELIVSGVTRLDQTKYHPGRKRLTINFRRMLLAICPDIRSMIVKLADRLHNMRTLRYLPVQKQRKSSKETMDIYAPLADRLGIGAIKWRLQDLSLKYLKSKAYHQIAHRLSSKQSQRNQYVAAAIKQVKGFISSLHIKSPLLYGRPKHIYSIYHKITVRHKNFDQIYDFLAMRVIVNRVSECYAVLSAIEAHWSPMPHRFKDYIVNPKPNGYQSLHITVKGPKGKPFEVQIRTKKMHQIAEYGVAAHWAYKAGVKGKVKSNGNNSQLNWFKRMIAVRKKQNGNQPQFYNFKNNLFSNHVYVLTPNGDVMELPTGSSPLDLAYRIHTEVGNHAIGAKVNGKIVSWNYRLKNGDKVAIMTSKNATPGHNWLQIVKTSRARQKIRQFFKHHNHAIDVSTGRSRLFDKVRERGYTNALININVVEKFAKRKDFASVDDLLAAIGFGSLSPDSVVNNLIRHLRAKKQARKREIERRQHKNLNSGLIYHSSRKVNSSRPKKSHYGVVINGISNLLVHLSRCCYPIPGDSIVGYITRGNGISIHRNNCKHVANQHQRLVNASWANDHQQNHQYESLITVEAYDRGNLVHDIIQVIDQGPGQLISFYGDFKASHVITIKLKIEVYNRSQLLKLANHLRGISKVRKVSR